MTVQHDAATEAGPWLTTPDPFTFTHTPVGTPKGVLMLIAEDGTSGDLITSVSYGGVALSGVTSAADTVNEVGRTYIYFLGAGIPTGVQTVSIDHTATSFNKRATCVTVTASGNTEIGASGTLSESQANPQIALDTTTRSSLRYCNIFSGLPTTADVAPLSGMTAIADHDLGPAVMREDRQTAAASGSFTIGYVATSDDCAMCAVAIQEIAGATVEHMGFLPF